MANSRKSKSSDLSGRVADALVPVVPAGSSILLGLSGGVDSVVLLHLLLQLAPRHSWQLSALHVHHGISMQADAWAAFCRELCARHGIPLQVEHVDIAPVRAMGVEAAARELRHAALACQPVQFIALAHHQDDQAETLLLQLLRGSGVRGASAMAAIQPRTALPVLLRPLLDIPRAGLLAYANQHGLAWVEDESNADDRYPRNFLRHRVLPVLAQHFPAYRATLARSAGHFAEAAELMDMLAEQDASGAFDGMLLAVARLQQLGTVRAKNLLRWFLHQRGALPPEQARLEEMLRQLCSAQANARVCVGWAGWEVHSYRGKVHVCHALPEPEPGWRLPWRDEEELALPQLGGVLRFVRSTGEGLSREKLQAAQVTIRLRCGEERLRPDAARPARTLKYLFQERGVPPWQREHWPLLYCDELLVAVPGIAAASEYRAAPGEEAVVAEWVSAT
ncbi:MAG: tRNA lysidine(34) synthetase TilS [Sideroxydans sp.]|nr:tRNA lysidine(34) synthetase TilS [Sideroxydans sp.]